MENSFSKEMKRVALLEAMGGSNLKSDQGSYIFKTILHPLFNIHIFIRQTYLNTSGNHGCIWISQWLNGLLILPIHNPPPPPNSYEYLAIRITDFSDPRKLPPLHPLPRGFYTDATSLEETKLWNKRDLPSEDSEITVVVSSVPDNIERVFLWIASTL